MTQYSHTRAGRRPVTILALTVSIGFLAFGAAYGAPWWWYPPALFAALLAGYAALCNPQSGICLDQRQLCVFSGAWQRTVALADLRSISIDDWSEGPPTATAHLKDGTSFAIPSLCLPKKAVLIDVLQHFGISRA